MSDLDEQRRAVRQRLIDENEFPTIPENWDVERLRFLFTESKERNGGSPVGEMLSVSEYRGVVPRDYENEEQKRTDQELENYRVVGPGQLAVNSMWLNHLGLGVSEHTGHVSPAYNVYNISDRLDCRFVHHLMRSNFYLKIYLSYLYGIRPNSFQIKSNDWASIPIIVPDLATQCLIADFLDRETARLDLLIEKKQRLVSLLGERFQARRHDAITRGAPESHELKSGPNKWFEEVPTSWTVKPLRHVVLFQRGHDLPAEARTEGQYPIYSSGGFSGTHSEFSSKAPGIVTGRYGTIGKFNLVEEDFWALNTALYSRAIYEHPKYVFHLLEELSHIFILNSSKSAVPGVDRNDIHSEQVPVPPISEQISIAKRLDALNEELGVIEEKTNASIDRLKEYRSALITAAVTGQIDVSTYAKSGTPDRHLDAIQEEMGA